MITNLILSQGLGIQKSESSSQTESPRDRSSFKDVFDQSGKENSSDTHAEEKAAAERAPQSHADKKAHEDPDRTKASADFDTKTSKAETADTPEADAIDSANAFTEDLPEVTDGASDQTLEPELSAQEERDTDKSVEEDATQDASDLDPSLIEAAPASIAPPSVPPANAGESETDTVVTAAGVSEAIDDTAPELADVQDGDQDGDQGDLAAQNETSDGRTPELAGDLIQSENTQPTPETAQAQSIDKTATEATAPPTAATPATDATNRANSGAPPAAPPGTAATDAQVVGTAGASDTPELDPELTEEAGKAASAQAAPSQTTTGVADNSMAAARVQVIEHQKEQSATSKTLETHRELLRDAVLSADTEKAGRGEAGERRRDEGAAAAALPPVTNRTPTPTTPVRSVTSADIQSSASTKAMATAAISQDAGLVVTAADAPAQQNDLTQQRPLFAIALPQMIAEASVRAGAAGTVAFRAETPRLIGRQLAEAALNTTKASANVSLNPKELGHVNMRLSTTETGVTLVIQAERPETEDLMRRHINELAREFREMGFTDINFKFGSDSSGAEAGSGGDTGHDHELLGEGDAEDTDGDALIASQHLNTSAAGLDIRI